MIQLQNYKQFGGTHFESAALKHTLTHANIKNPITKKPFSEPLLFGLTGGVLPGYSFCPSVTKKSSGISIIPKRQLVACDGSTLEEFAKQLKLKITTKDTAAPKAAFKNLLGVLNDNLAPFTFISTFRLPSFDSSLLAGAYTGIRRVVIHAINESKNTAHIADLPATSLSISLDDLAAIRGSICTYKNRIQTFLPDQTITPDKLKSAIIAAIKSLPAEQRKPRQKTFSIQGLVDWSKLIVNDKNKRGWLKIYQSHAEIFRACRDAYESIEINYAPSLMRPLYAGFLTDAAKLLNNKQLTPVAKKYRTLGNLWSQLANTLLTDKIKPLKQTKTFLQKRLDLYLTKGDAARKQIAKTNQQLNDIQAQLFNSKSPLSNDEMRDHLQSISTLITQIVTHETDAIESLDAAIN